MTVYDMGKKAKEASRILATAGKIKNTALYALADALEAEAEYILRENEKDLKNGRDNGMSEAVLLAFNKRKCSLVLSVVNKEPHILSFSAYKASLFCFVFIELFPNGMLSCATQNIHTRLHKKTERKYFDITFM